MRVSGECDYDSHGGRLYYEDLVHNYSGLNASLLIKLGGAFQQRFTTGNYYCHDDNGQTKTGALNKRLAAADDRDTNESLNRFTTL